jgi:hypothetical protein
MGVNEVIRSAFRGGPSEPEAKLRFEFYSIFVALAMANMLGFGALAVVQRRYLLGGLIAASGLGLVAGWLRMRTGRDDRRVYRVNALMFALLVLYMLVLGGESGSKSLWMYSYPLIVAFLFGEREGAVWDLGLLVCAGALIGFSWPWISVYPYPVAFTLRLLAMYVVVAITTLGFEYSRRRYRDAMIVEHLALENEQRLLRLEILEREQAEREKAAAIEELQETLAQVKTLKGLVPICANCHRIRDDQGFWNQLESYLREHSDAKFSHGICPSCLETLYPEYK